MQEQKGKALSGDGNKRLNNMDFRNQELTFPLADKKTMLNHSTIPSEEDVFHAKEWVDDGSRL